MRSTTSCSSPAGCPRKEVTVAVLHHLDGYTQDGIAESLDLSRRTVGKMLAKFEDHLKKRAARTGLFTCEGCGGGSTMANDERRFTDLELERSLAGDLSPARSSAALAAEATAADKARLAELEARAGRVPARHRRRRRGPPDRAARGTLQGRSRAGRVSAALDRPDRHARRRRGRARVVPAEQEAGAPPRRRRRFPDQGRRHLARDSQRGPSARERRHRDAGDEDPVRSPGRQARLHRDRRHRRRGLDDGLLPVRCERSDHDRQGAPASRRDPARRDPRRRDVLRAVLDEAVLDRCHAARPSWAPARCRQASRMSRVVLHKK